MKRTIIAFLLSSALVQIFAETVSPAPPAEPASRGVCSRGGSICILDFSTGEETPITVGHEDMKPSWSMEGDQIVFFRVMKKRERVQDWKTAICVVNADGTGFRQLTEGTYADYNPTWTKDGTHRIIYSRYFNVRARSVVHCVTLGDGEIRDDIVSDISESEYAMTALRDGRILITSKRAIFTSIHWLLTPGEGGASGTYEKVNFDFKIKGIMDRCSINPQETMVAYEYKRGYSGFSYLDKVIVIADFDKESLTVSNPRTITARAPNAMTLYPRWMSDGASLVYHSNREGKAKLYRYYLDSGETRRIEGAEDTTYEFFCGERWPK